MSSKYLFLLPVFFFFSGLCKAQIPDSVFQDINSLKKYNESLDHRLDELEKVIDDVLWYQRVGDVAFIDKVRLTGPPLWKEKNPTGQGAGNPVKFYAYVFVPRNIDLNKKANRIENALLTFQVVKRNEDMVLLLCIHLEILRLILFPVMSDL